MEELKLNKSFLYFLPVIYKSLVDELSVEYKTIHDMFKRDCIYNVYTFVDDKSFFAIRFRNIQPNELLDSFKLSKYYINEDVSDNFTTLVFSIPENCRDAYNKFTSGRYSKIVEADKKIIFKFISDFIVHETIPDSKAVLDTIHQVLNKSKERRDAMRLRYGLRTDEWNDEWELSSLIDVESETYRYGKN